MEISTEGNVWIIKHDNGTETRGTKEQILAIINPPQPATPSLPVQPEQTKPATQSVVEGEFLRIDSPKLIHHYPTSLRPMETMTKPGVVSLPEPPIPMTTEYKTPEVIHQKHRKYIDIFLVVLQVLIIVLIVMYSAKGG